jgi:hypothetical protein
MENRDRPAKNGGQGQGNKPGRTPDRDDQNDGDSHGNPRGTSGLNPGDYKEEEDEQVLGNGQPSEYDSAAPNRPSNPSPNQRRVVPSENQKR